MNDVEFNFGFRKTAAFTMLPAADLASVEPVQGLYAWFLPFPSSSNEESLAAYSSVFQSSKLNVHARGNFGQDFLGNIDQVNKEHSNLDQSGQDLLFRTSAVFMPPVYIGISSNLRSRLSCHYDAFLKAFRNGVDAGEQEFTSDVESDTVKESSIFGGRLADTMLSAGFTDFRHLFVKVVYDELITREQLQKTEFILNRIYRPILGRR